MKKRYRAVVEIPQYIPDNELPNLVIAEFWFLWQARNWAQNKAWFTPLRYSIYQRHPIGNLLTIFGGIAESHVETMYRNNRIVPLEIKGERFNWVEYYWDVEEKPRLTQADLDEAKYRKV